MKKIISICIIVTMMFTCSASPCFGNDVTETSEVTVKAAVSTSFEISESITITGGTYISSLDVSNLTVTNLTTDKTVNVTNIKAEGSGEWTATDSSTISTAAVDTKYINLALDGEDLTGEDGYELDDGAVAVGETRKFPISGTIAYQTTAMTDMEVAKLIVTISITSDSSGTGDESTSKIYYHDGSYNVDYLKTVTWADGTNEEIVALIKAIDAGVLDPEKDLDISSTDAWGVGAERTISLPAMEKTTCGIAYAEQDATFVILDIPGSDACNTKKWIDDAGKKHAASFIIGMKDSLNETYTTYMTTLSKNSTTTIDFAWDYCSLRTWCNGTFYIAMMEAMDVNANDNFFKKVSNSTIDYRGSSYSTEQSKVTVSYDYVAVPAEKEILGYTDDASDTEASVLEQFTWYADHLADYELSKFTALRSTFRQDLSSTYSKVNHGFLCLGPRYSDGRFSERNEGFDTSVSPFFCL